MMGLEFATRGPTFVYGAQDGTLRSWRLGPDGASEERVSDVIPEAGDGVRPLAVASDGSMVLAECFSRPTMTTFRRSTVCWDPARNVLTPLSETDARWVNMARFLPDGRHVVLYLERPPSGVTGAIPVDTMPKYVMTVEVGTWSKTREVDSRETSFTAVAFAPDGRTFAGVHDDGSITLYEVAPGGQSLHLEQRGPRATSLAISPDGKFLAVGRCHGRGRVEVWDLTVRSLVWTLDGPKEYGTDKPHFSPDGLRLCATWTIPRKFLGPPTWKERAIAIFESLGTS